MSKAVESGIHSSNDRLGIACHSGDALIVTGPRWECNSTPGDRHGVDASLQGV